MPRLAKTYRFLRNDPCLDGPHLLDENTIDTLFDEGDEYGVYLLLHLTDDDDWIVTYVGRGVLRDRLDFHRDNSDAVGFCFELLEDDYEGFSEECRLFHEYGKRRHLDNRNHPSVPRGAPKNFRRCSVRGCHGEPD